MNLNVWRAHKAMYEREAEERADWLRNATHSAPIDLGPVVSMGLVPSRTPITDALIDAAAKLREQGVMLTEVRITTAVRDKLRAELPAGLDCNRIDGLRIVIDDTATTQGTFQ